MHNIKIFAQIYKKLNYFRCHNIVSRFSDYSVSFEGIGCGPKGTEKFGECSQMAIFLNKNIFDDNQNEEPTIKSFFENNNEDDMCKFCKYEEMNNFNFISHGVCTYESNLDLRNYDCDKCVHMQVSYKLLDAFDYPYDEDQRTQEEKILDNAIYHMNRISGFIYGRYFNSELDKHVIPLYELIWSDDGIDVTINDLRFVYHNLIFRI